MTLDPVTPQAISDLGLGSWSHRQTPAPHPTNSGDAGSARDHLANERTFLAWLRTGVAIVVLGFAIGRLALFLPEARGSSASIWLGTAAIAAGIALCFAGLLRYRHTRRGIEAGEVVPAGMLIEVVAFGAALFGLILAGLPVNPV